MVNENVRIATVCGLCAGCTKAIQTASLCAKSKSNVVLFKEIVHNKNVNKHLQDLGIKTITQLSELSKNDHVILRAHGEPPETYEFLKSNFIEFEDCTCKNVLEIHKCVEEYSNNGYKIILLGKYGKSTGIMHPEVFGTVGWCKEKPILIENLDDLDSVSLSQENKYYLACQTTFNEQLADEIINKLSAFCNEKNIKLLINKTICPAQKMINKSSVELAKTCDIAIIVGGKNSSNSIELFNNVSNYCKSVFIEDINDWANALTRAKIPFSSTTKVAITAGASTLKNELITLKKMIELKQKELGYEN